MDFKAIARLLAASETDSRAQGFSLLVKYLNSTDLEASDMFRIWKSLFYCKILFRSVDG
jgi:hypothetical protein